MIKLTDYKLRFRKEIYLVKFYGESSSKNLDISKKTYFQHDKTLVLYLSLIFQYS